ncbi:MAG: sel1 repeat family protein [Clostridiales bacterium]|nr:sel1 repeat family protein [Clostridiales bacterium]
MKNYNIDDFINDYSEEEDYFGREDELAFRYCLNAALNGDEEMTIVLGDIYSSNGYGVIRDGDKAAFWYKKAADGGSVRAMRNLGKLYYDGAILPQDSEEAFRYFKKASDGGDGFAAYCLGRCYYYGHGVFPSDHEAYLLFKRSEEFLNSKEALRDLKFPEHELVVRAQKGDEEAQCALGDIAWDAYYRGLGMSAYLLAEKWYKSAAESGNTHALLRLGSLYSIGWGVGRDAEKSAEYYSRAFSCAKARAEADENDFAAKYWLGKCYANGHGVQKDEEKGYALVTEAAHGGYPDAVLAIASCYEYGQGREKDLKFCVEIFEKIGEWGDGYVKRKVAGLFKNSACRNEDRSRYWFLRAAENGDVKAQEHVADEYFEAARKCGFAINRGEDVEKNTAAEKENYERAFYWYNELVKNGSLEARAELATFYFEGLAVDKNYAKAVEILEPLARCTHGLEHHSSAGACAAAMLGDIYEEGGFGVERDEKRAFNWFYSAAERDHARARRKVGDMYFNGVGTERDYEKAAYWYEESIFDYDEQLYYGSDKGYNYLSNVGLGDCYRLGLGVEKDEEYAFHLYDDVSKYTSDCPAADERVARCYYFGIGVKKDEEKARDFWSLAAKNGDPDAIKALEKYFGK